MNIRDYNWTGPAVGVGAALVACIWYSFWSHKRGNAAISRWATEQGFTIVHSARRSLVLPWRATSSKGYQFFRVDVRDGKGITRQAWLRCSALGRTDPATVEVIWDAKSA